MNTPAPTAEKPLFGVQPPEGVYKPLNQLESPYAYHQPRLAPSKLGVYGPVPPPPPTGPRPDWALDIQIKIYQIRTHLSVNGDRNQTIMRHLDHRNVSLF